MLVRKRWVIILEDAREVAATAEAVIDTIGEIEVAPITVIRIMIPEETVTTAEATDITEITNRDDDEALRIVHRRKDVLAPVLLPAARRSRMIPRETH